jgi:hypothetical protein
MTWEILNYERVSYMNSKNYENCHSGLLLLLLFPWIF